MRESEISGGEKTCLQVGYGDAVITPPLGSPGRVGLTHQLDLPGDPILLRALYLRDGDGSEVLQITAEVVGLTADLMAMIRERIFESCGVEPTRIILTATHTHAGPWVWLRQHQEAVAAGFSLMDPQWIELLLKAAQTSTEAALASVAPARLMVGVAEVREVASNRLEHGWRSSWTSDPEQRAKPVGSIDSQVRVLTLCHPDGAPRVMLANYACHPTGFGGGEVPFASADFPYFAERRIARTLGNAVPLIYGMGCAGDINTGKFCVEGNDEEVAGFGVRLGDAILKAWSESLEVRGPIHLVRETHSFAVGSWMGSVDEAREHFEGLCRTLQERIQAQTCLSYEDYHHWRMALKRLDFCQSVRDGKMPVELIRLGIGPLDLLFVPGEWFHRLGLRLMNLRPKLDRGIPAVWVTTLANFDLNYVPDPDSFQRQDWYGVAPAMRILSDEGILEMIAETEALLSRGRGEEAAMQKNDL